MHSLLPVLIAQISPLWLLVTVACAASLTGLFGAAVRQRRDRRQETEIARLHAELKVFADAAITLGSHVARNDHVVKSPIKSAVAGKAVTNAQSSSAAGNVVQIAPPATDDSSSSTPNVRTQAQVQSAAMALAARGAGIDDLVAACDLSRSEAGLVIALQQRGRRVSASV